MGRPSPPRAPRLGAARCGAGRRPARFVLLPLLLATATLVAATPSSAAEARSPADEAPLAAASVPLEPHAVQVADGPSVGAWVREGLAPPTSGPTPIAQREAASLPPADGAASAPRGPMAQAGQVAAPDAVPAMAWLREALLWLLAAGGGLTAVALGWRHLHQRNILEHPMRADILQLIRDEPGVHLHAVARAMGLPPQQAAYHLQAMERLGIVASQKLAGRRCYHEAGAAGDIRRALRDAASTPSPVAMRVLAFVVAHPGASQSEVARRLGMLPGAARWHLRRLSEQGALVEAREGRALTYRPTDAASMAADLAPTDRAAAHAAGNTGRAAGDADPGTRRQ